MLMKTFHVMDKGAEEYLEPYDVSLIYPPYVSPFS
jgi:hypothetical protein